MEKYTIIVKENKLIKGQLMLICDDLGINERIEKTDFLKVKMEYNKLAKENEMELEFKYN